MKYAFIQNNSDCHSIDTLCRCLQVSRSGYYEWRARKPSLRQQADEVLLEQIRHVHEENRGAYGAVKTWRCLQARGVQAGKHRVARLRALAGNGAHDAGRARHCQPFPSRSLPEH